jgi:TctA family transporter
MTLSSFPLRFWALLLPVVAVFAPIYTTINAMMVLVLADLVCGVLAAKKRGEPIRSDRLRATPVKLLVYLAGLCLGHVAQRYLLSDAVPVVKLAAGLIGTVEVKSIFENLDTIGGGGLFASIVARLAPSNTSKNGPA